MNAPMTDELEALAARVEQATGPDAGLWGQIILATGLCKGADPTASLDAAMTLNPGWMWMGIYERPDGSWSAQLGHAQFDEPVFGMAATEELARAAAALRAIAQTPSERRAKG